MRNKTFYFLVITFLISIYFANAAQTSFYFIEPHGEGTTEDAQSLIDGFFSDFERLSGKKLTGSYLNDPDLIKKAFQKKKIDYAILPYDFYKNHKDRYKLQVIGQIIPLYSNGPYETFYLYTHKDRQIQPFSEREVFSSKLFANPQNTFKILFPNYKAKTTIKPANNILEKLKSLNNKTSSTPVLLTSFENHIIQSLLKNSKSFQNLKLLSTSEKSPASVLITTISNQNNTQDNLLPELYKLHSDEKGKQNLKELRIKKIIPLKNGSF